MSEVYRLKNVGKAYEQGEETVTVLSGVELAVS